MRPAVIVDVETTSLTPDYQAGSGVIWEIAVIERATGAEHVWRMKPDLGVADPSALSVGQFYKRTQDMTPLVVPGTCDLAGPRSQAGIPVPAWSSPLPLAAEVARLLDGVTVIAANPAFDTAFLAAFLRWHSQAPTWHYRLRDIGSMAWAWLQAHHLPHHLDTPAIDAGTDDLACAMGIDPAGFERHSALGDCRLVAAMLDVIERGGQ